MNIYFAYLAVFLLSIAANWMLIVQAGKPRLTRRQDADSIAVQSCHTAPTPRIGGVAVGLGLLASLFLMPEALQGRYSLFMISVIPVFAAGLCEDLGFRVSPKWRLIWGGVASLLAILVLDSWVMRVDLPGFDLLLAFAPVAIGFTIFAAAGLSHAFNLIDGLNGLSTGAACAAALGLIAIADLSGNAQFIPGKFMLIAALMGFLVFNFPWGRIFLGDAGAYTVGHLLAWSAILLVASDDRIAAWSIMLIFFWPIADTCLAIWRRKQEGKALGQPDQMHMHHLVLRSLEIAALGRIPRRHSNPLSVVMMMPMILMPVGLGVALWDQPLGACVAFFGMSLLFGVTYIALLRFAKRRFRATAARVTAA